MKAGISGTTESLEQQAESETVTQSMESAIELQPVDAQPLDSETGVQSVGAQPLDSETGVQSVNPQPLDSETGVQSVDPQPLDNEKVLQTVNANLVDNEAGVQSVDAHQWDNETGVQPVNAHQLDNETREQSVDAHPWNSETGVQPINDHPLDNETGVQSVDAHPWDKETGTRPIEATSINKPSPTTREEALESVPEFSSPTKSISELSDVSLKSNTSAEREINNSLDREEVRTSKVVGTNRKNIPLKKNRLDPLKMDMSKPVVMPLTSSQLSLQCLECHIIFSDSKSKERHLKQSHPAEYEQCMLGDALFACYVCDRQFTNSIDLMTHQRAHTEKQPFKCPLCGEAFRRSSELTLHKKVHMGQNGYSCLECGKPFKTLTLLKYHCRTHTGEKPYVCKECGKRFTMSIALQRHQRSHLLEGSKGNDEIKTAKAQKKNNDAVKYPCSICKANFKTAKTRMHHMKRKHSLIEPSVGQQIKQGVPIITPSPMCPPNFTHLETLGPLQQVDNIDTEQIRKLIESLGNVQRVNKVVILGQVPPHSQPLDLQRIQSIGEPLQLHLTQPQIELVELKGPGAEDAKLIELEQTVMPCQGLGTSTNSLEPVSLDVQMDPSILLTHAGEYAVPGENTEQITVEPQQTQTLGGELRPEHALTPTTAVQTAGRHLVNQCISQSEAAELEQAPEQMIVLHLTSLVPTLDLEQLPTVRQELVSSPSLLPTPEMEQLSAQPLVGPNGSMSLPTLTPTVELELTTSSLVQTFTNSQSPPDEVDQTDQGQETTSHIEMERKVQVNATLDTHSAKQTGELAVQDSADKLLFKYGEREELVSKSCDGKAQPDSKNSGEKQDIQLNMLQESIPPQETKQIKPVSQLPMNVMSVQEFVKVRKRKQATLLQHLEATQNVKKPTKGKKTKKARLVVKFGPKEKKSKKQKPSQPVKPTHKQKQTQGKNEMFVSMRQEKKVPSKQKAVTEKKDKKRKKSISKSETKSPNTLHSLQIQQMQGQPRKKKMKRQKDTCESLVKKTVQETITSLKPPKKTPEQMSKQELTASPKSQNKNKKAILHKGEPKKSKDEQLPGKQRKRKLAEPKLKTSSLSADKPDQKIVQQSLLLLKGHKQPQLKVYKLDATQAPDEPPHGQSTTTSLQSKDNTLAQRQKGTKSKQLTMQKSGVKKNVGRPRKNQKVLSLLPALFTSVSSETQPSKPKAARKRSAPSKLETEGVISSHSRRALACKDCGESFSEVSTLQGHKATMHAVQSPELTYTNGNIFEGVTGSDLSKAQKVSEKPFEMKKNLNTFDMHVASDWDMEAEVGEMVPDDKEGRVSFPALNPSPSLPLAFATVEGDAYEPRSLRRHDGPPERSTLSPSPPQIVSPGPFISDQVKTILSGQSPPHLRPIETPDRSHQTQQSDTGEYVAGEDKPECQDHLEEDTPKLLPPLDCTSEHQAPVEEEIKEELLLDVNLVTVGEQNEREGQNLTHASGSQNIDIQSQILDPSSQCEVECSQETLAHARDRNVRTSETRPNTQSSSCATEPPEIKQEEEETLVQKKVVERKGVPRKNWARGKRRTSGRGRRSLDGLKRIRSDKDAEECQIVYQQHSLTIDSEVNDAVEAGSPQPCQLAAPSLEICSRLEPHRDVACATSAPSLPYSPEELPEEQVVFELESVTTSVEEVLKSGKGLRMEVVGEQDRNDGQSPGIILERFLTSRQRDGEDDLQCSDSNLIPHTSQSIPSFEQQRQQSIKSVLVKQEINITQNDNRDTQGLSQTHNASILQTDVSEKIGSSTVSLDSSIRQCIFYPVKEEEREVLLEQYHPGTSSSPVQGGQFVEHQAVASSGGLYEISSAEGEPHVTRGGGTAISDAEEGELDTELQDTSKLLEFLLNGSDEEDSVNIEFPDPHPEPEVLVVAGSQNVLKHGQLHTNDTTKNLPASSHPAHLRPTAGSAYTQRDEQANGFGKPIDYFLKYFGPDTWADIANCTNKTSILQNPVTAKEVSQFVGIHIAMGTLKFPSLKLYWQDFTKVPLIAEAMSASRFSQLSRKLKLASPPLNSVRHIETPITNTMAGPARPGSESSGHSDTSHSQIHAQSPKLVPSRNSVANRNGESCTDKQNCHTVKIDPLWRVRPLLHRIQAGCLMLRKEGDHGVDQYSIPLTARAGNHSNNLPYLHSTVLVGSSGMILNLDFSLDLSEKEATVEKMVPRDGMVYLCKQELSTPAMLERLLGAGVHGAGKVGGARGQIGDEFVSSDGKLMLRRSHHGFILSTVGKGQQYMASLVNKFDQAEKAAQLNRDLRNLYRTPPSTSAPSSWPQLVLWYLTDVALVNSWLHYRQGRGLGPELLNLMAFRLEVSKALILSSGSDTQDSVPPQPPAQTLHTKGASSNPSLMQVGPLPDPSIRYDGSGHWPEQLEGGEEGRCRFGGCERTSSVRCLKCCVFLCISRNHNCFLNFHSHGFF